MALRVTARSNLCDDDDDDDNEYDDDDDGGGGDDDGDDDDSDDDDDGDDDDSDDDLYLLRAFTARPPLANSCATATSTRGSSLPAVECDMR